MEPELHIDLPLWASATIIVVLLVVSAYFSVAETALISASRPRMHALARKGNRRAQLVEWLSERQVEAVSAMLLGYNIVNIFASALATAALVQMFGDAGVAYAALAMTALVVVFGEVMPKTFALAHADRVILALAPSVQATVAVLSPVNRTVQFIVHHVLRLLGAQRRPRGKNVATEELRGAIELHAVGDTEVGHERKMLRSILDLANVTVGQIAVHRRQVVGISADQSPAQILEQALASPYTRVPLWRGQPDNVVGVLHAKALLIALRAKGGNPDAINPLEIATRPWFIPESTTLLDQLEAFRRRREHFALVVDEYGALVGAITLQDIIEEIVGDIAERHDFKMPGVRPQPDGSYMVDGHVTIRDLNREYDWHLPDAEAATIAGLVLHEARRIPEIGQIFTFHGFRFEILRRKRNQITALRIAPPAPAEPASATSIHQPAA
jgi:Mg2+/Co2+ transporter CorB